MIHFSRTSGGFLNAHGRRRHLVLLLCACAMLAASVQAAGVQAAGKKNAIRTGKKGKAPAPLPTLDSKIQARIHRAARSRYWIDRQARAAINRTMLVQALEAARAYYLNQQLPEGNFVYARDVITGDPIEDDSQVRQAGALWGLSCLNRDRPTNATRHAVVRGLDFFYRISSPLRMGHIGPIYPGDKIIKTGTVALVCLAIIELWRGQETYLTGAGKGLYDSWLSNYLDYLEAMEMDNGSWGKNYYPESNRREPVSSPYYDGECLLAYCRAARYMGRKELIPRIEASAPLLAARYTVEAWQEDADSDDTKGFFQWGCMAFAEYVEAGWKNANLIADAARALAYWQLYEYRAYEKNGNAAYAIEGLLAAYKIAKIQGDAALMGKIRKQVEDMLSRLVTWQVGGPAEAHNPYFKKLAKKHPATIGGIMSSRDSGFIRIDIVQHQVHAMLMALEVLYPEKRR